MDNNHNRTKIVAVVGGWTVTTSTTVSCSGASVCRWLYRQHNWTKDTIKIVRLTSTMNSIYVVLQVFFNQKVYRNSTHSNCISVRTTNQVIFNLLILENDFQFCTKFFGYPSDSY